MQNEFKALLKNDIYAILDGDTKLKVKEEDDAYETIMPYLTGQQLVDLCKTFGLYQQYGASRWTYVDELLKYGIQNDRCDEILAYIFDKERFTSLTRLSSPEEVNEAYKTIVNAAIDRINSILYLGRTELQCVNGNFYVTEIGKTVSVATVYKGNIIKNLIMDCQSYTKYRPNETTGGIFVSWRRKEELPTGA